MTPRDLPLRVALIGAGGIAQTHARAYAAQPERCRLVAVSDIALSKAEALGNTYGCPAYQDPSTMLDQAQPDAVSVCTPPAVHLQGVRAAVDRGIAVLCEKPLSYDLRTANEMVTMAEERGVLLMTALCHRFHGPVMQLKDLIDSGKLGRPILFQNRFAFRFDGVEKTWFVVPAVSGGGVLIDTEVHAIDLFRYLIGEVATVSAYTSTTLSIVVEDSAVVVLSSREGTPGVISCSWVSPPGEARIRVYGTLGTASIDYSVEQEQLRYSLAGQASWQSIPYEGPDRFVNETAHFIECVVHGRRPQVDGREGLRAMAIIEAAYRAAQNGTVENV